MENYAQNYWDKHYRDGKDSGPGSYGDEAALKVKEITGLGEFETILDVGCGDFNIGKQILEKNKNAFYAGVDVSPTIIVKNLNQYAGPKTKFMVVKPDFKINTNEGEGQKFELVLCLDVLFHIKEQDVYDNLLQQLKQSYTKYLVVSNIEEYKVKKIAEHVIVRKLETEKLGKLKKVVPIIEAGEIKKNLYIFEI